MPYINVEVELSEFDSDDLINELQSRLDRCLRVNNMPEYKYLTEELASILPKGVPQIPVHSVIDEMKLTHLAKVFDKYSLEDLERLLPE